MTTFYEILVMQDHELSQPLVKIPNTFSLQTGGPLTICHGLRSLSGQVAVDDTLDHHHVMIHELVMQELLLKENVPYQILCHNGQFVFGPSIGLLLGNKPGEYTPAYMAEHYSVRAGAYPLIGGTLAAFTISAINWDIRAVEGLLWNAAENSWEPAFFPLPSVIYRRHLRQKNFRHFRNSYKKMGGILFNTNRWDKWKTHKFFLKRSIQNMQLPATKKAVSEKIVLDMLHEYKKIVLKPVSNSQGRGILFAEKLSDFHYSLTKQENEDWTVIHFTHHEDLINELQHEKIFKKRYLSQSYIDLSLVNGRPFDIRVIMQKKSGWVCSGIECRLAGLNQDVTNLSQGGSAFHIQEMLKLINIEKPENIINQIQQISKNLAARLDETGEHFAELGIDLALDRDQKIWLIEINFRPGYKGFIDLDYPVYEFISRQPFLYAAEIQGFSVQEE
ncbi:YheC/YheD family protein [Bacillus sp. FJAT-42376]|uniref:YheC/YheD family endospore coat-associated protein n=1 Tax=Bacillus sp. FJAT-42376 TaxID=2014076 RepID=UPI0013DE6F33|nr:YheC/YheD family protein [Bacillus sp. FJAT-42376]